MTNEFSISSFTFKVLCLLILHTCFIRAEFSFKSGKPLNFVLDSKETNHENAILVPEQFKLSYDNNVSNMILSIHFPGIGVKESDLRCSYAVADEQTISIVMEEEKLIKSHELFNNLHWREAIVDRIVSYHHSAGTEASFKLVGLIPNVYYVYTCVNGNVKYFKTGDFRLDFPEQSSKMIWAGDMGLVSEDSRETFLGMYHQMEQTQIDSIVIVGDISYADAYNCSFYEKAWNIYLKEMETLISHVPFMVIPGNHEHAARFSPCDTWANNFIPYNAKLRMPNALSSLRHSMWYSYTWRHAHIIGISSETDYPNAPYPAHFGDQLKWLEEDLKVANANRHSVPWIIVMGHRPIYSSHTDYSKDGKPIHSSKSLQEAFEDLLFKYQVDLYICGHVHSYERTHPVYKNEVNPKGPVHIVNGHAGNPEGRTLESSYANPPPSWSAFHYTANYGYAVMEVSLSKLSWTMFTAKDGDVADQLVLTK